MSRSPTEWPDAQRSLHEKYALDATSLPRTRVHWRLYDATAGSRGLQSRGAPLAGIVLGIKALLRRRTNDAPVIAVWDNDEPGAVAVLIFEFDEWPQGAEGDATLVGECEPNGALCLELADGTVVWPTYNPRRPSNWLPTR